MHKCNNIFLVFTGFEDNYLTQFGSSNLNLINFEYHQRFTKPNFRFTESSLQFLFKYSTEVKDA